MIEEEIENLEGLMDLLETRGDNIEGIRLMQQRLQQLSTQSGQGDVGPSTPELEERIAIVRKAIQQHREAGEVDHAVAASQVLEELQAELQSKF